MVKNRLSMVFRVTEWAKYMKQKGVTVWNGSRFLHQTALFLPRTALSLLPWERAFCSGFPLLVERGAQHRHQKVRKMRCIVIHLQPPHHAMVR